MKRLWGWCIALARGAAKGASERAPLPGNLKDGFFFVERYAKCLVGGPLSL
jgi:hypothetical protein